MLIKIGFLFLLLQFEAVTAKASSLKCANLFPYAFHEKAETVMNQNYGYAHQADHRLLKAQVIEKNKSMLCGPTCVYNALEKFKIQKDQKILPDNETQDIIDYVQKIFPNNGVPSKNVIQNGLNIHALASALKVIAHQSGLNLNVEVRTASNMEAMDAVTLKGFSIHDLKKSTSQHHAAIVLVGFYKTTNLLELSNQTRIGGHYMLVAGYNTAEPHRILFQDPESPSRYKNIGLSLVKPKNFTHPTYQLFDPAYSFYPIVSVIERVILIHSNEP